MKLQDRKDVQNFIIDKTNNMLGCFTVSQCKLFRKMFPNWPKDLTSEQLANAIDICERTLKKQKDGLYKETVDKPTHHRRQTTPPPRTIKALLMQYKPLAIENERQYHEASEWVDELAILDKRTAGQERFLETLTVLMEAYEEQHYKM